MSDAKLRAASKAGLSAAATKAKLFADHEEREIQRLSANIINHQVHLLQSSFQFHYFTWFFYLNGLKIKR